ncbi:MAG: hypothetical protein K6T35_07345, partial [Meiothermus silvanus]|nr:hypothetical protein [Allomeiothermus silvanus]
MDFQEADELCAATGTPVAAFVAECARRGITAFAVRELTVESLGESATASVLSGDELLTLARLTKGLDPGLARLAEMGEIHPGCTYLVVPAGASDEAARLIIDRLESRASQAERHRVLRGGAGAVGAGFV